MNHKQKMNEIVINDELKRVKKELKKANEIVINHQLDEVNRKIQEQDIKENLAKVKENEELGGIGE